MFDTHFHPDHMLQEKLDTVAALERAREQGVSGFCAIGTDVNDSATNIEFAKNHNDVWATIAQHPHEASWFGDAERQTLSDLAGKPKVVAVGECGLDYYYENSDRESQKSALQFQLELGRRHNLPFSFHIRGSKDNPHDAFNDFFPMIDALGGVEGIIHSFSANVSIMNQIIERGLYMGLNGIMTFSKDPDQLEVARTAPLENIVLETDSPFLTPAPFRGKVNEPKYIARVAEFLSEVRSESLEEIVRTTTVNAKKVFRIDGHHQQPADSHKNS